MLRPKCIGSHENQYIQATCRWTWFPFNIKNDHCNVWIKKRIHLFIPSSHSKQKYVLEHPLFDVRHRYATYLKNTNFCLAQCRVNSCPLEDGWWHQLLWSRARTNGQLTSTCPLHNNQQENQIEISSHSSHESRTGFGPLGIKEEIAIQAIRCTIVLTVL